MSHTTSGRRISRRALLRVLVHATSIAGTAWLASSCQSVSKLGQELPKLQKIARETGVSEVEKQVTRVVAEARKAPLTLGRALWVLHQKSPFAAYNEAVRGEATRFCEQKNWPLNIGFLSDYAEGGATAARIAGAVRAGAPPDLLLLDSALAASLRRLECLDSVTTLVTEVAAKWGPITARVAREEYVENAWWMVPAHQNSAGGWYRTDVWGASGTDIHALKTYPELLDACLKLSQPDYGLYGWGVTINACDDGDHFVDRVITGWGGQWQDESGQYVTISSPETVEALTWLKGIYQQPRWERMLPPNVLAWTDRANDDAFLAGNVAYTQSSGTLYARIVLDKGPLADLVGFHTPAGGPKVALFGGPDASGWAVPLGSRNAAAAHDLVRHTMLNLEPLDAILAGAQGTALPCYAALWDESRAVRASPITLQQRAVATEPLGIIPWTYPGPSTSAMAAAARSGIKEDMVRAVLAGIHPMEAVQAAHLRMVRLFQQSGLPGER